MSDFEVIIKKERIDVFDRFKVVGADVPAYTGSYEVTPLLDNSVVLPTKNKSMSNDVTVRKIPWEEVSNPQGGLTITIGGY